MNIEEFVNELSRPLYVWRMARALRAGSIAGREPSVLEKGAPKRMENAKKEIESLVLKYAEQIIAESAIDSSVNLYPQVRIDDRDEWPNDIDAARDYGGRR